MVFIRIIIDHSYSSFKRDIDLIANQRIMFTCPDICDV